MGQAAEVMTRLKLDNAQYAQALEDSKKRWIEWGAAAMTAGRQLLTVATIAAAPLALSVREASKMEETMNKFDTVFGKNAKSVKEWSDATAQAIGRSKQQMADFMAGTQDLFVPLGFGADEATRLSKAVSMLAVDMASFNNTNDADSLRDLHAALTGQGEVMKKYGVILNETTMAQKLMQMAIDPKTATEQQKVQARLNVILDGTRAAQGDAARSAGSFANQMKSLRAATSDAAVEIGGVLLPIVTPLVTRIAQVVREVGKWSKEHAGLIALLARGVATLGAVGAAIMVMGMAAKTGAFFMGAFSVAVKGLDATISGISAVTGAVSKYNAAITDGASKTQAFKGIMGGLNISPVAATVGALSIVAIAISYAVVRANEEAKRLAKAQRDAANEAVSAAEKNRQAVESEYTADQNRISRLKELSKEESLAGSKKIEAANLIDILTNRYGDLGVSIDATTGKLTLQNNAFEKANGLMKENRMNALKAQQEAVGRALQLSISQFDNRLGKYEQLLVADKQYDKFKDIGIAGMKTLFPTATPEMQGLMKPILDNYDQWIMLEDERRNMLNDTPAASAPAVDMSKVMEAQKELAKSEQEVAKNRRTAFEQELFELEETRKARIKNLDVLEQYAAAELKAAKAAKEEAEAKEDFDATKTAEIRIAVAQEELDKVGEKRKTVQVDYDTDSAKAKAEQLKKLADADKDWQQSLTDRADARGQTVQNNRLDKLKEVNKQSYMDEVGRLLAEAKAAEDAASARVEAALKAAKEDGVLTDDEGKVISDRRAEMSKASGRVDEYQRRLDAARATVESSSSPVSGSFYANILASAGRGTAADRTAQNTKDTVDKLAELGEWFKLNFAAIVKKGGPSFGR